MSGTIRVGFIGCGLIARSHARGLTTTPDVAVVAVHDIDPVRAKAFADEFATGPDAVRASAGEVIAAADAVYVCSWTSAHPAAVGEITAAGKAVFCEKPLAVDYAAARAMTEQVTAAGVTNQVGLVLRRSPSFRWINHRLSDAGTLMNIVFRDDQYLPTQGLYQSTWRADKARAGAGALLEHSIHDMDLLTWMMGPIASVSAHVGEVHGIDGIDDQVSVLLRGHSGAQATLTSVWHDVLSRPSQRRVEVFCKDVMLTVSGDWNGPVTVERSDTVGATDSITSIESAQLSAEAAALDGLGVNADAGFIDAVRSGQAAYPDFSTALEAHRLVDAAYRSAGGGGEVINLAQ